MENTTVTNFASVNWTLDGTDYMETYSEDVVVPTSIETAPRTPKPVTLDGASCENPLTALGEGISEHDVTECEAHASTAAEVRKLAESQDWNEAKNLWNSDIAGLYAEWIEKADAEGARNAEDEQAAFAYHMNALEASLGLVCDPAEVGAVSVEERMNKCVRLCYELHSAPGTRSDSLEGDHAALPKVKAGNECRHEAAYLADGSAHIVDDQCESHQATTLLTGRLLEMAADDEDKLVAWQRIQGNWLVRLNAMYDVWYLSSDVPTGHFWIATT